MSFTKLLAFSIKEILRYRRVSIFLILNLALGLVGFFLLQVFQQSLVLQSAEKAQIFNGGDISISARRSFSEEEVAKWEKRFEFIERTHYISSFSMLRANNDSRLVKVGVFDNQYPLYGEFKFSDVGLREDLPRVWVDPEVQEMFNLKKDDLVEIGELKFLFSGVILEDPTRLLSGVGLAPRVIIHKKFLQGAGLIKPGSTFNEYWRYKTKQSQDNLNLKKVLENEVSDPAVQIEIAGDDNQDSPRVLKYFTDYLGLVALVALGLCFLCGSYLLQWNFLNKRKNIAVYKTLGLSDSRIILIYVLQNILTSILACFLAFLLVAFSIPYLQDLILNEFKLTIYLKFNLRAILITCFVAIVGPLFMAIPQIIQILALRPLSLFQNFEVSSKKSRAYVFWLLMAVFLFWVMAVLQSRSYKVSAVFTAGLVVLSLVFSFLNSGLLFFLEKISKNFNWVLRYSIKGLTRRKASASLVFTTMSLATLVLSLLPHIKASILNEVRPQSSSQMPSLFMFDIQPEQVSGINELSKNILNQELPMNPLVRSRILKVNDKAYERSEPVFGLQTREADNEARFRNRGINLTYREYLQESESLLKGQFSGTYSGEGIPQVSLEHKYADRVGVKIGDVLTFDVQGIEVKAEVASLRQVRWTSFQPNFFILFPKGVLEDAPQIFLASVAGDNQDFIKRFKLQVSDQFKNVSIVDVKSTIEGSLKYIDQMSLGLQLMAWLAVVVGVFVFVVLLNTQVRERLQEMNLMQILGTQRSLIFKIIFTQFMVLILCSLLFGILLGLLSAWILIYFFFEISAVFDLGQLIWLVVILIPACWLALIFGLRPLKNLDPMDLIRQI